MIVEVGTNSRAAGVPPQMASAMATGNCDAFCVGEPWNMQVTINDKTGRMAAPSQYIFDGSPDKVFAMKADFYEKNPNTEIGRAHV